MFSLSWLSVCCTNHESCIGLKWFHCCHYCLSSGFQRTRVFLLKNKVKRLFSVWVTQEDRWCYIPDCQVWYLMDLLWWTWSAVEEIRPQAFQVWGSNFQVWPVCTSHKDPHPQPLTQCPHFHITLLCVLRETLKSCWHSRDFRIAFECHTQASLLLQTQTNSTM